jgi:tetratricopeptide (TPR) repeat protein
MIFQATLEREMECRAKFYQEHESAFDSVVTKESPRLAHLTALEKEHFIDDEVMTNSILHFMKNCDVYTRTMTNIKTLYFKALDKRKQEGTLKGKKEFLAIASTDEKGKEYSRQAAEAYGNVAMLYELEGDMAQADQYYKKSLSVYPTPIMMAFYHLLKTKKK